MGDRSSLLSVLYSALLRLLRIRVLEELGVVRVEVKDEFVCNRNDREVGWMRVAVVLPMLPRIFDQAVLKTQVQLFFKFYSM